MCSTSPHWCIFENFPLKNKFEIYCLPRQVISSLKIGPQFGVAIVCQHDMDILRVLPIEVVVGAQGAEIGIPHGVEGPVLHLPSCDLSLPLCLPVPSVQAQVSGQH